MNVFSRFLVASATVALTGAFRPVDPAESRTGKRQGVEVARSQTPLSPAAEAKRSKKQEIELTRSHTPLTPVSASVYVEGSRWFQAKFGVREDSIVRVTKLRDNNMVEYEDKDHIKHRMPVGDHWYETLSALKEGVWPRIVERSSGHKGTFSIMMAVNPGRWMIQHPHGTSQIAGDLPNGLLNDPRQGVSDYYRMEKQESFAWMALANDLFFYNELVLHGEDGDTSSMVRKVLPSGRHRNAAGNIVFNNAQDLSEIHDELQKSGDFDDFEILSIRNALVTGRKTNDGYVPLPIDSNFRHNAVLAWAFEPVPLSGSGRMTREMTSQALNIFRKTVRASYEGALLKAAQFYDPQVEGSENVQLVLLGEHWFENHWRIVAEELSNAVTMVLRHVPLNVQLNVVSKRGICSDEVAGSMIDNLVNEFNGDVKLECSGSQKSRRVF